MTLPVYKKSLTVTDSSIDAMGHVNNLVYLQWCIEAAKEHWISRASLSLRQKYLWYVLRHEINYINAALVEDELLLETWVVSAEGVRSERCYRISRPKDGKIIIEGKTIWCFMDASSQKPIKITEEIRNLFQ